MSTLEFLVPDALVAPEFAPDLLRDLRLPHLTFLAAHALEESLPGSLATSLPACIAPWQAWLMRETEDPNLAHLWAYLRGDHSAIGEYWLAEPVHLMIGHDHLVLQDPARLDLTRDDAELLVEAIRLPLQEAGWSIEFASTNRWFLTHCVPLSLRGTASDMAVGRNVAPFMPQGEAGPELAWRRLSTEVQMIWHTHPVNARREAQGLPAVNALWFSGNGKATDGLCTYRSVISRLECCEGLPCEASATRSLETFEGLIVPAREQDWSSWRNALQALDLRLGEITATLRNGEYERLALILTSADELHCLTIRKSDFWKFWRRGAVADLLASNQ